MNGEVRNGGVLTTSLIQILNVLLLFSNDVRVLLTEALAKDLFSQVRATVTVSAAFTPVTGVAAATATSTAIAAAAASTPSAVAPGTAATVVTADKAATPTASTTSTVSTASTSSAHTGGVASSTAPAATAVEAGYRAEAGGAATARGAAGWLKGGRLSLAVFVFGDFDFEIGEVCLFRIGNGAINQEVLFIDVGDLTQSIRHRHLVSFLLCQLLKECFIERAHSALRNTCSFTSRLASFSLSIQSSSLSASSYLACFS